MDYGDQNLKRIHIIGYLQRFSFTLREIKELLEEKDASPDRCIDKSKAFDNKLKIIEKEISELKKTRDDLLAIINV